MKRKELLPEIVACLMLLPFQVSAQEWHWQRDDLVLNPSGLDMRNTVSWAWGDLDQDGYVDILVRKSNYFDDGRLVAYRGRASTEPAYWVEAPELLEGFDESENSTGACLADFDGDGFLNIITHIWQDQNWRFLYWKKDQLGKWMPDTTVFQGVEFGYQLNDWDDPFFADVDDDGDPDMLTSVPLPSFWGVGLRFFENIGTTQQPMWREDSTRLESVYQNPIGYYTLSGTLMRVDADSLPDLVVVSVVEDYSNVAFYPGIKDSLGLRWSGKVESLGLNDSGGLIKLLSYDIEKDGRQALIVLEGPTSQVYLKSNNNGEYFNKSYFRVGPIQSRTISSAIPFDYHNDGEVDLLAIGHFGGFWGDETRLQSYQRDLLADMVLWRNTNWFGRPAGSLDAFDFKAQLVDLDKNGLFDFVESCISFYYSVVYENSQADFQGEWSRRDDLMRLFLPGRIVGDTTYFDPSFADLDGDADLDLLIAEMLFFKTDSGRARYRFFENQLSDDSVSWKTREDWWAGLGEISYPKGDHYGADMHGHFADLDKDGDADLVFGRYEGGLLFYENIGGTASPAWQLRSEVFTEINASDYPNPSFGDFDNDGRLDLFIGNTKGELFFYRNETIVGVEEQSSEAPRTFHLHQNFPNPFNAGTLIAYEIPQASHVRLTIYDLLGRKVATLVDKTQSAGSHRVTWSGAGMASGVYFYELRVGTRVERRKLVLMR